MPRRSRELELTPELVALVERLEPDPGPEPGTDEHTDEELVDWAKAILDEEAGDRLYLFAYGSLIWKPDFEFEASQRATASGWHRSFCMRITRWRGTRDLPALMMTLDRGGSCTGVLYKLPDRNHVDQVYRLLDREIDAKPATNTPRWINIDTDTGRARALAFVADRDGPA